jgi:hypothetical protein
MNPAARAKAMLIDPAAEWALIARESGDPAYLLSRYVAALALIPAVFGFIGSNLVGMVVPGTGLVRASLFNGGFGAIFAYALAFAIVLVLALIINLLAPLFGAQKDFDNAFKLAAYSYTPVWLAGIFLLLPGLRFLILLSFYGAYVLLLGLPRLMKAPEQKYYLYTVVIAVCACALTLAATAMQHAVFNPAF